MPANLTPQYLRAEKAYRQATSSEEQLEALRCMLREIPKHKGTDRLQADLKAKIARLKMEIAARVPASSKATTRQLLRQGAGRVLLIGAPNVGKSQILSALTRAKPLVAAYPYATQTPMPGMMSMEDCSIQLVDMPPISSDYLNPETYDLVRTADLIFWLIDLSSDTLVEDSQAVLDRFQYSKTRLARKTGPVAAEIGSIATHTLIVLNKIDLPNTQANLELLDECLNLEFDRVLVSAKSGQGLTQLPLEAFRRLDIVRVYAKDPHDRLVERTQPFFLKRGQTVIDFARQIHGDFADTVRSARVWGEGHKDCAVVKPDYQPRDRDVIELQTST